MAKFTDTLKSLPENGVVIGLATVALLAGAAIAADQGLIPAFGSKAKDDYDDDEDYDY